LGRLEVETIGDVLLDGVDFGGAVRGVGGVTGEGGDGGLSGSTGEGMVDACRRATAIARN
jgi:hypothetical protein